VVYRRSEKEMPAYAEEIEGAKQEGIAFLTLTAPNRILAAKGKVTGFECLKTKLGPPDASGRRRPIPVEGSEFVVDCDVVIPAIGQRIDLNWAADGSGPDASRRSTIRVHPHTMQTSIPYVFAAGDVAEHHGFVYGTWGPSQHQGSIAGMNAVGAHAEFGGIPRSNALKVLRVELFSIGRIEPVDGSYEIIEKDSDGKFFEFVFRDSHLVGAILLGDAGLAAKVKKAVESRFDFSGLLAKHPGAGDVLEFLAEQVNS